MLKTSQCFFIQMGFENIVAISLNGAESFGIKSVYKTKLQRIIEYNCKKQIIILEFSKVVIISNFLLPTSPSLQRK